jgi:hypothetical protein
MMFPAAECAVRGLFRAAFVFQMLLHTLPVQAEILLRFDQVGPDVVVTGSGSATLAALLSEGSSANWTNYFRDVDAYVGPDAFNNGSVSLFSGLVGPLVLGSDASVYELPSAAGSGGDLFGIQADDGTGRSLLVLPDGYSSGASLSGVSTFPSRTLAQLGLTPGQTTSWSWGSGASADALRLKVVPAPAPLLGVVAGFRLARALRRRQRGCRADSAVPN